MNERPAAPQPPMMSSSSGMHTNIILRDAADWRATRITSARSAAPTNNGSASVS
jgi:hypothetical protein